MAYRRLVHRCRHINDRRGGVARYHDVDLGANGLHSELERVDGSRVWAEPRHLFACAERQRLTARGGPDVQTPVSGLGTEYAYVTSPDGLLLSVITVTDLLRVYVADAVIHA